MARSSNTNETLVGLFVFVGLGLLGSLILLFGNVSDWFKDRYEVKVFFEETSGVIKGSTVRLRGAKIGQVGAKPELTSDGQVEVILLIDDDFKIPLGSEFQIGQASLLGDKEILITPSRSGGGVLFFRVPRLSEQEPVAWANCKTKRQRLPWKRNCWFRKPAWPWRR